VDAVDERLFATPNDARRFLVGLLLFAIGLVFWIISISMGYPAKRVPFWLFTLSYPLSIVGTIVAGPSIRAVFEKYRDKDTPQTSKGRRKMSARRQAMAALYSKAGFREAIKVARKS
jgi:TRAP-type C4-dicarboxylate transport system permease small subunit